MTNCGPEIGKTLPARFPLATTRLTFIGPPRHLKSHLSYSKLTFLIDMKRAFGPCIRSAHGNSWWYGQGTELEFITLSALSEYQQEQIIARAVSLLGIVMNQGGMSAPADHTIDS